MEGEGWTRTSEKEICEDATLLALKMGGRGHKPRNEGSLRNWILPWSLQKEYSHADTLLLGPLTSNTVR